MVHSKFLLHEHIVSDFYHIYNLKIYRKIENTVF